MLAACMQAAESAPDWLAPWQRYTAQAPSGLLLIRQPAPPPDLAATLAKLPAPESWEAVAEQFAQAEKDARPARRARLRLGRWLLREMQGRSAEVAAEIEAARAAKEIDADTARSLLAALGGKAGVDDATKLKSFEAALAEKTGEGATSRGEYFPDLPTPDLVTLAGAARAEELLRKALIAPVRVEIESAAEPTRALAKRLARELAPLMRTPQWALVGPDDIALFEAMQRRFGAGKREHDYTRDRALGNYIVGLILFGRPDDALREAAAAGERFSLPYDLGEQLGRGGYEEPVRDFLHRLLEKHPGAPDGLWSSYRRLAVQTGKTGEMLDLIRRHAADPALEGAAKVRAQHRLAMAELAVDDVARGLPRLREALAEAGKTPEEARADLVSDLAGDLIEAGLALGETDAAADGVRALDAAARATLASKKPESYQVSVAVEKAIDAWMRIDRADDALKLADEFEGWARAALAKVAAGDYSLYVSDDILEDTLKARFAMLVARERWDEAQKLLVEHDAWGEDDAAELIRGDYSGDEGRPPFGVQLARVAQARGDRDTARRALETLLVKRSGNDAAYAAYVELLGAEATPLLDRFFELDAYEERPLIWKAVLASRAKNWPEAERLARAAIAVDPSDGEQGRGDRMRVYSVLGEARAAQGDEKEAKFFADVVRAIRLSEEADRWHEAGLFARSLRGYQQALELFADAYCVQSRLAIRLAEAGRMDEAMEHYRRAYELMPDSFGRVESHCFGCEKAFAGEAQQGVAEEIFTRMAAAHPTKAQVPYLLGYLRSEQERLAEAAEMFARATELDPLYLNAWNKLDGLADRMAMPAGRRDAIALKLIELDPLGSHASPDFDEVSDSAALWRALAAAKAKAAELPEHKTVLRLTASAAKRAKAAAADGGSYSRPSFDYDSREPGAVFSRRSFAEAVDSVVQGMRHGM